MPVARALAAEPALAPAGEEPPGRGVVAAIRTGFQEVGHGPALVIMADLSDDLRIVPRMLDLYRRGYRIVCPSRYVRGGSQSAGRGSSALLSRTAGVSLRLLAGFPTHDATNNFRLYDAALVNELGIESTGGFELALELTAKAFRRGEQDRRSADDLARPDGRHVTVPADEMAAEIPLLVLVRPRAAPAGRHAKGTKMTRTLEIETDRPLESLVDRIYRNRFPREVLARRSAVWQDPLPIGSPAISPVEHAFSRSPRVIANSSITSRPPSVLPWT